MAKVNLQKIKDSAATVVPVASIALPFVAPNASKSIGKMQTAVGVVGQIGHSVNNTMDSAKNARKNNPYHNKLNSPYAEKYASEDDEQAEKRNKKTKTLAKIAPYAVGGSLLLAYGAQAAKDKSPGAPIKKAVSDVPASVLNQIKKKSSMAKGAINGAKKGLKEANNVTVVQHKKTPFESLVNGAAWGAGTLGVHMLGSAFFKNKTKDIEKSYKKSQPAMVKVVETAKEVKELVDKHKKDRDEQEKTASIKGAEFLKKITKSVADNAHQVSVKAKDAGVDLSKVWDRSVMFPAATALTAYVGKELLSSPLRRHIQSTARENYLHRYNKKKGKAKETEADNEKTASIKNALKGYVRKYGETNLENIIKPVVQTATTIPLIYGMELLKQKGITKKIEKRNAERENQQQEREGNNRGRDYKGSERNNGTQHNI